MTLLLMGLVHSVSLIEKMVAVNETERRLLDLMANYKFDLMGSVRSMSDLMRGFSISFMVAAIGFGALDLLLSNEREGLLKRLALINTIWLAVMTAVSLRYFFILPTSFFVAALVIFALAWGKLPAEKKG
ncbi:MAG: hypothetical protein PVS2B2_19970 [Candidatus Acidiferrum sp.]